MPDFNPSVLADIGNSGPDIPGAQAKAFTLKDMVDANTLNQFKIRQAKQEESDTTTARKIASENDFTTPEGASKAAAAYQRAGMPDKAMDALKANQSLQSGQLENQIKQLQVTQSSLDTVSGMIDPVVAQVDAMRSQGKSDAVVQAYIHSQVPVFLENIDKSNLPPDIKANMKKRFAQNPNVSYDELKAFEGQTSQGRQQIAARLQDFNVKSEASTREKTLQERVRHDTAEETKQPAGQMSPKAAAILSEAVAQGVPMPSGTRSVQALNAVFSSLADRYPDASPQEIIAKVKGGELSMGGLRAEEAGLGRRQAGIETSAEEARKVIPIAMKASDAVPRGKFVPLTKLIQAGKVQTSDPALAAFAQANLTLANVYPRAMSPTGTPTVEGREEALNKLSQATSPEAYKAVVGIIQQEIEAARTAPASIGQQVLERAGAAPGGAAQAAPAGSQNDPLGIR